MNSKRPVPRRNRQIDIDAFALAADWTAPTEMEMAVLSGGHPPNFDRLLKEIEEDPELAMLSWKDGETLLHVAASQHQPEFIRRLLEGGADVNAKDAQTGTALHSAAECDDTQTVIVLLEHGASTNVLDGYGRTPLHHAALRNNTRAVELLLENGASVKVRDKKGRTALDIAAGACYPDVVKILVKNGATSKSTRTNHYIECLRDQGLLSSS